MVQCQQQTGVCTRPPTSEGGGRKCKSCHPDHFWKAGRYKLAAPVSKTGSAHTEVGALPTPSSILAVYQNLTATSKERKSYATCYPIPKPVALPQELQTKSCHSHPTGPEAELHFSSNATVRFETATGTRFVAQQQSTRPITGRRRIVTCRD